MRFLNIYQYAAPAVLFPLSYWLWWQLGDYDHRFVLLVVSMPVLFAYVIPGLGTNWLGLWEFHTRLRLGKFRPQHGFVFGAATSLFAYLCYEPQARGLTVWDLARSGFVLGSVLAVWNWWYDIYAIKQGLITVHNGASARNEGAAAIATEYAPALFGTFGACYGVVIRLAQYLLLETGGWRNYGFMFVCSNLLGLVLPVAVFVGCSYLRTGTTGLRPVKGS